MKTYNGVLVLGKRFAEEVQPLFVRRAQKLQQRKEQRTSLFVFFLGSPLEDCSVEVCVHFAGSYSSSAALSCQALVIAD
jgi:hypothetical protein